MNSATKIASLILAGIVCAFYWGYISEVDSNLEVSRMVLSQRLREKGRNAEADYYESLVHNKKIVNGIKDPKLATLTKFIDSKRFDAKSAVNANVATLSKANDAVAYARIAKAAAKAGVNADVPLGKSLEIIKSLNPVVAEKPLIEFLDAATAADDAKRMLTAIKSAPFSIDLLLRIYKCSKTAKIKKLFREKLYEQDFPAENPGIAPAMKLALIDMKKISQSELEWTYRHAAFKMKMSIYIWKMRDYNFPLFAYLAYWDGNEQYYQHYRAKSLTPSQYEAMKAGFLGYVEYGSNAFALANDPETALQLLSAIPNREQHNLLVKRAISNIISTDEGLNLVLEKGILK